MHQHLFVLDNEHYLGHSLYEVVNFDLCWIPLSDYLRLLEDAFFKDIQKDIQTRNFPPGQRYVLIFLKVWAQFMPP